METDAEKFIRLATRRTNAAIKLINLLGNLSNRSNYKYTEKQVAKIMKALRMAIDDCEDKFARKEAKRFTLEDCNIYDWHHFREMCVMTTPLEQLIAGNPIHNLHHYSNREQRLSEACKVLVDALDRISWQNQGTPVDWFNEYAKKALAEANKIAEGK